MAAVSVPDTTGSADWLSVLPLTQPPFGLASIPLLLADR
jgi:hypothetical protein